MDTRERGPASELIAWRLAWAFPDFIRSQLRCDRTRTLFVTYRRAADIVSGAYVPHHNTVRLTRAIGYITPMDMLVRRQQEIHAERDRKLEAARKQRQIHRKKR